MSIVTLQRLRSRRTRQVGGPLAIFDKAIEWTRYWHEGWSFLDPDRCHISAAQRGRDGIGHMSKLVLDQSSLITTD